jgi:RHS repeat-associated protein
MIVDEEFKKVSSPNHMGVRQVEEIEDDEANQPLVGPAELVVRRNGWLYVYLSNESDQNVYFDDLVVNYKRGPVTEVTDYYPFGLTMTGISSKALAFGDPDNNRKFNKGSELQSKEFSDGSGLELYATNFRSLDPQLGRWWQIDPKPDYAQSLYASMNNNPIKFNDPLGDTARIHFRTGFLGLGKRKAVDYNNGSLTNTNGTAYTGKVKGFLKKAVAGLNRVRTGGENGNRLVTDIQNSTQTVNIMKGDNGFTPTGDRSGMANVVRWRPGETQGGPDASLNRSRPAFIGLGHELAHSWDQIHGGVDWRPWYTPTGATTAVPNAEIFATHIENLLRAENGIRLRAFYSVDYSTGTPRGEGSILTGTSLSRFYRTVRTFEHDGLEYDIYSPFDYSTDRGWGVR